jgi:putative thiamine transport system permease protein
VTGCGVLRQAPRITLALMALPVAAGLTGTVTPLFGPDRAVARLLDWPGLPGAVWLSVWTGVASTLISLVLVLLIVAALHGGRVFALVTRALSPLLALPHSAAALGLAFLIAPSGWIVRALSPWATGWTEPPDLLILNDPMGWSLIAGLVIKEVPFLLLMMLAALPQADAPRRMMLVASLGYGQVTGWLLAVLPAVWPQIRLPVAAVLAYAMTTVDMALILGPGLPPTLSVQLASWMMQPDLSWRASAAAGAVLQLGLVIVVLAALRLAEAAVARAGCFLARGGRRGAALDEMARPVAAASALLIAAAAAGGLAGLALWSAATLWPFPDVLPQGLTARTWAQGAQGLAAATGQTLLVAVLATGAALVLTLACLEAEARFGLRPGQGAMGLLYLPLIVPQIAFLPGLAVLAIGSGAEGSALGVAAVHLVFVLPYVFLSLSAPWRAWDGRIGLAGAALGASANRVFWHLRLPMLLRPVVAAAAVGLAVSVGQYLPTLLIGGGRVVTLTTEAVALSSGGNRRIIGAYAMVQTLLPVAGFALALALPALMFRNRRGMRA